MSRRIPFGAPIATVAQMRAAEQAVIDGGVSVDELMERAGFAVAREVRRLAAGRPILVAAGPGNKGGSAYVTARHLAGWGLDVMVAALGDPREGPTARMAARWTGPTQPLSGSTPRPVFVDGLFGTGSVRPPPDELGLLLDAMQSGADLSIAIDLPSGMDADSGEGAGFACVTVALGGLRVAHVAGARAVNCGHVLLADIGVPIRSDATTISPAELERIDAGAQKFSRGMVAVVGGAMPGASMLAATAAMNGGAGYVLLAERSSSGNSPNALVRRSLADPAALAALVDDERIGAAVIGPGLGRDERAKALLDRVLASQRDLVIDADALSLLAREGTGRLATDRRQVFLTPHSGEFDRLFGTEGGNKIDRTVAAAKASGATIVHKGADTVIASPEGQVIVSAGATPWLSTAGTGDVLAGLLGSRHAHHRRPPMAAASEAVWLHADAAARAVAPFIADEVVRHLPAAVAAATRA